MLKKSVTQGKRGWKRSTKSGFDPDGDHRSYTPLRGVSNSPRRVYLKPIIDKTLTYCAREEKRAFLPAARDGEPRKKYVIHPSQLGGCTRKAFFSFVHAPKDKNPPDPRLQRVFDVGHEGHRRIQGYFFEAWRRGLISGAWEDVKLSIPGLCLFGELDGIVEVIKSDRVLVEIKTAKSTFFNRIKRPEETWIWQCHVYMKAVGLRAAIILIECKDTQDQKEFWFPFDEELWEEIEARCSYLTTLAQDQLIPVEKDTSACRFCNYQGTCGIHGENIDWETVRENVGFP